MTNMSLQASSTFSFNDNISQTVEFDLALEKDMLYAGQITFTDNSAHTFTINTKFQKLTRKERQKIQLAKRKARKRMRRANNKSWELVKDWLDEEDFARLMSKGELEVQSKENLNTIYIIKKDSRKEVIEKKYGKMVNSYCLVPKESDLPAGDGFLSKLLLLQNNEKKFLELARKYCRLARKQSGSVCWYEYVENHNGDSILAGTTNAVNFAIRADNSLLTEIMH